MLSSCDLRKDQQANDPDRQRSALINTLKERYEIIEDAPVYEHAQTIEYHRSGLRFDVYSHYEDSYRHSDILIVSLGDRSSAIPILPLKSKLWPREASNFWSYENRRRTEGDSTMTFQHEYNRMLHETGLADSQPLAMAPYWIVVQHIMHTDGVELDDTARLQEQCIYSAFGDSVKLAQRNKKNVKQLIRLMKPSSSLIREWARLAWGSEYILWGELKEDATKKSWLYFKAFDFSCPEVPTYEM